LIPNPLPPCFEHQCENKGVRSVDLGMNIKTKDLAPNERIGVQVICFDILTRSSDGSEYLS
jgi:hypothetical protein